MAQDSHPGVSICMVAYNSLDKLRACLASVLTQESARPVELILVDNASAEPVAEAVAREFPSVRLEASAANLGFAGGTNRAVALAGEPLILLLNPDTILPQPDTLERFCAAFAATPGLGALGCHLLYPDGSTQMLVGRRPTVRQLVLDLMHLGRTAPAPGPLTGVVDSGYVSGAALLTTADIWRQVGPLDESYFMYFEDVDWCRRAEKQGYRVAVDADLCIVHHEGASYGGREFQRREHFWRAFLRYARRHEGALSALVMRLALAANGLVKLPLCWLLDRGEHRAARLGLLCAQLRLGLRGA